jgi:Icc protein
MKTPGSNRPFQPRSPDAAGVISWVHLGDLHMTKAGEQNHLDLAEIVNEVNRAFTRSISFVFLPGDVADDGSRAAYSMVRGELDRSERTHYAFTVDSVRFVAMNAFDAGPRIFRCEHGSACLGEA